MKAWRLEKLGGALSFQEVPRPVARPGGVVVRLTATSLMSYIKDYVEGKLSIYHAPSGTFTPGGNAVGVVESVGSGVWHVTPGQRVVLSSYLQAQENVPEPGQMLLGITAVGPIPERMQAEWRDGTFAEYVEWPVSAVTVADGLDHISDEELAVASRFLVPYGGFLKGQLAAGETVVISGATGAYGAAAVQVALAMGAARVVALGRNATILEAVVATAPGRVVQCGATGDVALDAKSIRHAAGGSPSFAFDQVGGATDPNMTLAALQSLAQGGRIVLMGSMSVDLPVPYTQVMINSWQIIGQFMYPRTAFAQLLNLVRSGQLALNSVRPVCYPLEQLHQAMQKASDISPLECVVLKV